MARVKVKAVRGGGEQIAPRKAVLPGAAGRPGAVGLYLHNLEPTADTAAQVASGSKYQHSGDRVLLCTEGTRDGDSDAGPVN